MRLPFDSHNHVHMGPTDPARALQHLGGGMIHGMAVMSTHPRDYERVLSLRVPGIVVIPAVGIHPWWLHELNDEDWMLGQNSMLPRWIHDLEDVLDVHPEAAVGETGLDGFHYEISTKQLASPLQKQIEAFRLQLQLAARYRRPISIHCVQAFGPMMTVLEQLVNQEKFLPPVLYFHAFGGKAGMVDQIVALLTKRGQSRCYFGFAPVVNFRAPKTADVVRQVGLARLVLETDHEDAALVQDSLEAGIHFLAKALDVDCETVVDWTTANAYAMYNISEEVERTSAVSYKEESE